MSKRITTDSCLESSLVPTTEEVYEIPDNWVWAYLGALTEELRNGTTIKQNKEDGGEAVTRIESIQDNLVDFNRLGFIADTSKIKTNDYYEIGDIALSHINSMEHVGKSALIGSNYLPLVHGMNLLRIRLYKDQISPEYAQLFMRSYFFRKNIRGKVNQAVNQVSLNQKKLKTVPFPLPPLSEQLRITNKVNKLINKIDKAKNLVLEAKETFEIRRASILKKAFSGELTKEWRRKQETVESTDVLYEKVREYLKDNYKKKLKKLNEVSNEEVRYNIPASWKWVRLGEIFHITSGGTPKRSITKYYEGEIPWLKTGEITWNNIYDSQEHISDEGISNSSAKLLPKESVLVAMYGQGLTRGRAAVLKSDASCNQAVCALLPNQYVLPEYLFYYFMEGYQHFRQIAKGGNQENLSAKVISEFAFPLPPLKEQKEIVEIINNTLEKEKQVNLMISMEENLESLKSSILSKAFRGQLGTNDSSEESSIGLLEQILKK